MAETFIGSYLLGIERFFNPNTCEYTFNYTLIEELIDGMKSMDSVSYIAQAKNVLEVLGYHSLSILSGMQLIPTLSDGKQRQTSTFSTQLSQIDRYILEEQLIVPFYSKIDEQFSNTIQALNIREDIDILVMGFDFPISIFYDSDSNKIKIENKFSRQSHVQSPLVTDIDTWKKELSIKEILHIFCHGGKK